MGKNGTKERVEERGNKEWRLRCDPLKEREKKMIK